MRATGYLKYEKADPAVASLPASVAETSGNNSVLDGGEPKQRPGQSPNPEQVSPRLSREGIKVVSGPPGVQTGLLRNQSLIEHLSLR